MSKGKKKKEKALFSFLSFSPEKLPSSPKRRCCSERDGVRSECVGLAGAPRSPSAAGPTVGPTSDTKLVRPVPLCIWSCRPCAHFAGLPYKPPQSDYWLNITGIYSLAVLEARNLKSRCWQGRAASGGSRGKAMLPFPSFHWGQATPGTPRLLGGSLRCLPPSPHGILLPVCFLMRALPLDSGPSNQVQLHLILITSAKNLFPSKVTL